MNPLLRHPMRHTVPLLLLIVFLAGSSTGYRFYQTRGNRLIENEALYFVRKSMERNQQRLSKYLYEKSMELLLMNIKLIAGEDIDDAALVADKSGRIVAASNPAWQAMPLAKAPIRAEARAILDGLLKPGRKNSQGTVMLSRDKKVVYSAYPLVFGDRQAAIGLFYHEHDLGTRKAEGGKRLARDAITIFSLFAAISLSLWLYFHFLFFRRYSRIFKTIEQFGHGNDDVRSNLAGSDELADLSGAIDSMLDIKVAAQRQLRENARLLKQLTDGLPLLIAYVDREERYRIVNQEFEKWFYMRPELIVGRQIHALVGDQGYAALVDCVRQALAGKVVHHENTISDNDKGTRQFRATLLPHFENGSGVVGCFLLAQDITQQKIDHDLIAKAKEQWERTFDSIPDEIITIQDTNFHILQANSTAAHFFGMPREAIIGKSCYELFRNENLPCTGCPAHAVLQEGKNHSAEIYHDRLKKNFLVTISPMKDERGELSGLVHSAKDITQFKELEQQLRQAQKMEAIGTLAGGIAHDFNNILTPILAYSELVMDRLAPESEARRMVQNILNSCMRARELVRQILTFSRQGEQQRQPVMIHLIIKEALKLLRATIPATIVIKDNIPDCGMVMADPTQIHQVLMNLCTNAYHAMRENGGEMGVSLSVVELTAHDYLDNLALVPGPHAKLSIRDTGCGISRDLMRRIFEPYFTTKKQGEGTGLGLAMVYGIVQSHQGHITVYSEPGQGTEFHVYLPCITANEADAATTCEEEIPSGSGTILLVDDETEVGQAMQRVLTSLGYEVMLCASGALALKIFARNGGRIDLVLTDMTMPAMTGAELARRIKQLSPATPVILCTGFSEIMDEKKAKNMGIDAFLLKPVIKVHLARAIHELLAEKRKTSQKE